MARRRRHTPDWSGGVHESTPSYGSHRGPRHYGQYYAPTGPGFGQHRGPDYGQRFAPGYGRRGPESGHYGVDYGRGPGYGGIRTSGYGPGYGRGYDPGPGYGPGRGIDRGIENRPHVRNMTESYRGTGWREYGQYMGPPHSGEDERSVLERRAESLRNELHDVEDRLNNLHSDDK